MGRKRADRAERAYLVSYDISDPRRWRRIFRTMKGYGTRLQLSVWHCRLDDRRRVELSMAVEADLDPNEDQLVIIDLGVASDVELKVESFGATFSPIERTATIL